MVTAHKFAAGHRYLSYLRPSSDEQATFLRTTLRSIDIDGIIWKSKQNAQYMIIRYFDFSVHAEGDLFEQNRKRKGISRPALQPLCERVVIEQSDEQRGSDWHALELQSKRLRWSGPNPRPKILIPYSGHLARFSMEVIATHANLPIEELSLYVEDRFSDSKIEIDSAGKSQLVADIQLRPDDYTVLTVNAPTFRAAGEDRRKLGVAVGDIVIEPL